MIITLRILFSVVLASMLGVTFWAGLQVPLWDVPRDVAGHPWFIATMFDAYWGFILFYAWIVHRETSWPSRVLWLVAILLLGNIAMASYGLAVVLRLPADADASKVLLRGAPTPVILPVLLIAALLAVGVPAALSG